jgi:hypothetical protein
MGAAEEAKIVTELGSIRVGLLRSRINPQGRNSNSVHVTEETTLEKFFPL